MHATYWESFFKLHHGCTYVDQYEADLLMLAKKKKMLANYFSSRNESR